MDMMLKCRTQKALYAKLEELGLCDDADPDFRNATAYVTFGFPHIWSTPPEYDDEGNVTVEGKESSYFHINVRDLHNKVRNPVPYDEETNPTGTDWGDVRWIDPADVATPALRWA